MYFSSVVIYHQRQNKWYPYPQLFYLPISNLRSILSVLNLLSHNNIVTSYYVHVNSIRLKKSVASKWAGKHLWGSTNLFCSLWYIIEAIFMYLNIAEKK